MTTPPMQPAGRPMWILVLLIVALLIGLANVAAFLYGLTLPDDWQAEAKTFVAASPDEVYPLIATAERWAEWSAWSEVQDPSIRLHYDGPKAGERASFSWLGEHVGRGKITITEAQPGKSIRYTLDLQGSTFSENARITLQPENDGTRIIWTDGGEVEGTLGRFFRKRLEESVTAEFESSLERLSTVVERSPTSKD
ncbi:MAG: SRPBCC family protein [Planctomycetaceae bacterium]